MGDRTVLRVAFASFGLERRGEGEVVLKNGKYYE